MDVQILVFDVYVVVQLEPSSGKKAQYIIIYSIIKKVYEDVHI